MCGRYTLTKPPEAVAQHFDCDVRDNFPARYNIAPSQPIAIIRVSERAGDERKPFYQLVRWGFIPEWAGRTRNPNFAHKPLINARSETIMVKPTFRNAFKRRRCLIPADGFYEWKNNKGTKHPYYCRPSSEALFAFAGVWETVLDPGGGEMDTAAILTAQAGTDLSVIYHREPVVILPKHYKTWLTADERDLQRLLPQLTAQPQGSWYSYPVSREVGNVRHDGPSLIEPGTNDQLPQQGDLF